jgi:hypothetical protein
MDNIKTGLKETISGNVRCGASSDITDVESHAALSNNVDLNFVSYVSYSRKKEKIMEHKAKLLHFT